MRLLLHVAPPWADSGYGGQTRLMARALRDLGHDVGLSLYAGVHEERPWEGIPVYATGGKTQGNGIIRYNARRHQADLVVLFTDVWIIEPSQLAGLDVACWIPVDQDPLGAMNRSWLSQVSEQSRSLRLLSMSAHGKATLDAAGYASALVPHAVQPELYPDADAGKAWRAAMGIPPQAFIVGKVGVNDPDDRKAYDVTMQAFAGFRKKRHDVGLYVHAESFIPKCLDLGRMAADLGLMGAVAFCDQDRRKADGFSVDDMRGIYNGIDVLDCCSRGEGFCVPSVEALACGTPVIAARNTAMPEKVRPGYGWLVNCQLQRAEHHQAWWSTPLAADLMRAYQKAHGSARMMRPAAAAEGARWSPDAMRDAWEKALTDLA